MGGNALKGFGTRRMTRSEYEPIVRNVIDTLRSYWPECKAVEVQSFRSKSDFGDADIVLCDQGLDWTILHGSDGTNMPAWLVNAMVALGVPSKHYYMNKPTYSIDVSGLQVDLIITDPLEYEASVAYYSWNDLGNLMGRVAHKMGFKYGHRGLEKPMRELATHQIGKPMVTQQLAGICKVLGYDYERLSAGFDTIEEIWEFAASTEYFSPEIYDLANANAKARVRDSKRTTYTGFVKWIEANAHRLPRHDWTVWPEHAFHDFHLGRACGMFPDFGRRYFECVRKHEADMARAARWNGELVRRWTGLQGKELGAFMDRVRQQEWFSRLDDFNDIEVMLMTQAMLA